MQKNLIQSEWVIKWQIKFIVAKWKAVAVRGNYPLNLHAKWWALKYDSSRMSSQKKQKKRKPEQIKCLEVIKKKKRKTATSRQKTQSCLQRCSLVQIHNRCCVLLWFTCLKTFKKNVKWCEISSIQRTMKQTSTFGLEKRWWEERWGR